MVLYRYTATGTDAASWTWRLSASVGAAGGITAYSGVDPTSPVEGVARSGITPSGTAHAAPATVTNGANRMVVSIVGLATGTTFTPPTGTTERVDVTAGASVTLSVADVLRPTAGNVDAATFTAGAGAGSTTMSVVLAPSSGGTSSALILEAEDAEASGGIAFETTWCPCSGSGAVGSFGTTDDVTGLTWTVNVPFTGYYLLQFRYGAGDGPAIRRLDVNGSQHTAALTFPGTTGWGNWTDSSPVTVSLRAGANTIRLRTDTAAGSTRALTLDQMTVIQTAGGAPAPTVITLVASAADLDGSVARVEFRVDGTLVATATEMPYSVQYTAPAAGRYTVTATAVDNNGNVTVSAPVSFFVGVDPSATYRFTNSLTGLALDVAAATRPEAPNLALWLDASDASTITATGGAVTEWRDKSGNNRNVSQASASARPTYNAGGWSATMPAISFDGVDDGLLLGSTDISRKVDGQTILAVIAPAGPQVNTVKKPAAIVGETGFTLSGTGFGSTTGWVTLVENADGSGVSVPLTVTAWTDTMAEVTVRLGTLSPGARWMVVIDTAGRRSTPYPVRELPSVAATGLVGRWMLDETTGSTAFDVSGWEHHGAVDSQVVRGAAGVAGTAYAFDAGGQVRVGRTTTLDAIGTANGDATIAFWVRPSTPAGSWRPVFNLHASGISDRVPGIWLYPSSNHIHFRWTTTGSSNPGVDSATALPTGQWSQVTLVKSGSTLRVFINGVLNNQGAIPGVSTASNAELLLCWNGYGGRCGGLDDVRLYSRALSDVEIAALADPINAGTPPAPPTDPGGPGSNPPAPGGGGGTQYGTVFSTSTPSMDSSRASLFAGAGTVEAGGRRLDTNPYQSVSAPRTGRALIGGSFDYANAQLAVGVNGAWTVRPGGFQDPGTTSDTASAVGGVGYAQASELFQGRIAELVVVNSAITTAERQHVEGYLAWKWGLTDRLSGDHPYRYSPPSGSVDGSPVIATRWDTNRLVRTEQFHESPWGRNDLVALANAAAAPDGTQTATRLMEGSANTYHQVWQESRQGTTGVTATYSIHVKAVPGQTTARYLNIRPVNDSSQGSNRGVTINPATGEFVTFTGSTGPSPSYVITALADGWYRVAVTARSTGGLFWNSLELTTPALAGVSPAYYPGDGASGVLLWGAQLEVSDTAGLYQRVDTTATGTAAPSQRWAVVPTGAGRVQLVGAVSTKAVAALGAANGSVTALAPLSDTNTAQQWTMQLNGDGTVTFIGAESRRVLVSSEAATASPVRIADATGSAAERWIPSLVARSGGPSVILGTGPIAFFRLGERSGTTAIDLAGRGATASYAGAPLLSQPGAFPDDPDTAVSFTGANHLQANVPGIVTTPGSKTTAALWLRWDGDTSRGVRTILGVGARQLVVRDGCLGLSTGTTAGSGDCRGVTIDPNWTNRWIRVVVELDATNPAADRLWINGVAQSLSQRFGTPGTAPLSTTVRLGGATDSTAGRFVGLVDEFVLYDRALTGEELTTTTAGSPSLTAPALWLDAADTTTFTTTTSGDVTRWRDKSGRGNHVTTNRTTYDPAGLNGQPTIVTDGATVLRTPVNFNQPPVFATIPVAAGSGLDRTTTVSVSAWIRPSWGGQNGGIVDKTIGGATNTHYQLFLEGGRVVWRLRGTNGGWYHVYTGWYPTPGQWTHVVGTSDGTTMRVYVNGLDVGSTAAPVTLPSGIGPLLIGQLGSNAYSFVGAIDDVAVYPGALSATEVVALSTSGDATTHANAVMANGPLGFWRFDETDTAVTDASGNGASGARNTFARADGKWPEGRALGGSGNTVFVVGAMTGSPAGRLVSAANNNWLFGWWAGREDNFHLDGWAVQRMTPLSTTPRLYAGTMGNGQATLWRNGTMIGQANGGFTGPNGIQIGGQYGENSVGTVSEVIVYDRVLTDAERQATEAYLAAKWGIAVPKATTKVSDTSAGGLGGVLRDGDRLGQGVTGIADLDGDGIRD
ncbi:MAG: LamG-like jellyroll fold domain-containing protein, partial [Acidimicrobiales bacterium]